MPTMSLTSDVFGLSVRKRWWVYFTVRTTEHLSRALGETDKPVVFMFSADWNEPCKVMKKPFWDMALAKRRQAVFCVVDIDPLKDAVAQQFQVEALPTFVLWKNGAEQGRVVGAKVEDLKTTIDNKIL